MIDDPFDDPDAAADQLVDHLLQQELGARCPPDLAARIASADAEELAAAAARVDAAASLPPEPTAVTTKARPRLRWLLAAAAVLVCAAGARWWLEPAAVQPPPRVRAQALLDAFHAAMPTSPVELHDAARRRELAPQAIPVMRQILALHAECPDQAVFGSRIVEFELYGAVLGDEQLLDDLRQRAASGDPIAAAELQAVRVTTGDDAARRDALTELANAMPQLRAIEGSVVRWLDTADLSVAEAEGIAPSLHNSDLRRVLLSAAELAATGPRRWIGQPIELVGRLLDDQPFSTTSLRGREVVVCFWASWCAPSLVALDELQTVQRLHPEIEMVGVSCDHDLASLRNCLAEHGNPGQRHFFDRNRPGWHELAAACGVRTVPLTLLIDREGVVREVVAGPHLLAAVERTFGR